MPGGGLVLGFYLPSGKSLLAAKQRAALFSPNAFIRIGRDGAVTLIVNKSEMGQGVYTSLPMLIAEELECDWKSIRLKPAPVDPAYNHPQWGVQGTGGSTSVRSEWERLSNAGATAREMLIAAAAKTWKVNPASCRAEKGRVIHESGKTLTYGELAEKAAEMPIPKEVKTKRPDKYKIVGKARPRLDSPLKINGKAQFGMDVKLPGMLTAVVARPPVFGGKVVRFNADKARAVPGVHEVIEIPRGVAVVASGFWPAQQGREALEIVWDDGKWARLSTSGMREEFAKLSQTPGTPARKEGDAEQALAGAVRRLSAEYEVPYLAHATMEPLNCCVELKSDGCDIWTGTQFQTFDRNAAAAAAGLKPEQVRIHTTYLGGGFGRRANPHSDFVVEAVEVAKTVKKPVK
ncbi:MAG: molybdopterin cofactor-binding domain-containing protein, partial [Deltaproteobacteria bacterium]